MLRWMTSLHYLLTKGRFSSDVVIKSFGENGEMEYSLPDVTKLDDVFMITGAVEHFSTVGYGSAASGPNVLEGDISQESHELLIRKTKELVEQMEREKTQQNTAKKFVRTIEFDEILFYIRGGSSVAASPARKAVEQPATKDPKPAVYRLFKGKYGLSFTHGGPRLRRCI